MNFCPNCGSSLSDEAKFCSNCGHTVNPGQLPDPQPHTVDAGQPDPQSAPVTVPLRIPEMISIPASYGHPAAWRGPVLGAAAAFVGGVLLAFIANLIVVVAVPQAHFELGAAVGLLLYGSFGVSNVGSLGGTVPDIGEFDIGHAVHYSLSVKPLGGLILMLAALAGAGFIASRYGRAEERGSFGVAVKTAVCFAVLMFIGSFVVSFYTLHPQHFAALICPLIAALAAAPVGVRIERDGWKFWRLPLSQAQARRPHVVQALGAGFEALAVTFAATAVVLLAALIVLAVEHPHDAGLVLGSRHVIGLILLSPIYLPHLVGAALLGAEGIAFHAGASGGVGSFDFSHGAASVTVSIFGGALHVPWLLLVAPVVLSILGLRGGHLAATRRGGSVRDRAEAALIASTPFLVASWVLAALVGVSAKLGLAFLGGGVSAGPVAADAILWPFVYGPLAYLAGPLAYPLVVRGTPHAKLLYRRRVLPHTRLLAGAAAAAVAVGLLLAFVVKPLVFPDRGNVHLDVVAAVEYAQLSNDAPLYLAAGGKEGPAAWDSEPSYTGGSVAIITMRPHGTKVPALYAASFHPRVGSAQLDDADASFLGPMTSPGAGSSETYIDGSDITLMVVRNSSEKLTSLHYDDGHGDWGDINLSGLALRHPMAAEKVREAKLGLFNAQLQPLPQTDVPGYAWPETTALRLLPRPKGSVLVYAREDVSSDYDNAVTYVALVSPRPVDEVWQEVQRAAVNPLDASGYRTLGDRFISNPGVKYFWEGSQQREVDKGYGAETITDSAAVRVLSVSDMNTLVSSGGDPASATIEPMWRELDSYSPYKLPYTLIEYYVDGPTQKRLQTSATPAAARPKTAGSEATYAAAIEKLLNESVADRKQLVTAVAEAHSNPTGARRKLAAVVAARQRTLADLRALTTPPSADRAHAALVTAFSLALDSDRLYLRWLDNNDDAAFKQAQANDQPTVDAKKRFLRLYNAVRASAGLAPLPADYPF